MPRRECSGRVPFGERVGCAIVDNDGDGVTVYFDKVFFVNAFTSCRCCSDSRLVSSATDIPAPSKYLSRSICRLNALDRVVSNSSKLTVPYSTQPKPMSQTAHRVSPSGSS